MHREIHRSIWLTLLVAVYCPVWGQTEYRAPNARAKIDLTDNSLSDWDALDGSDPLFFSFTGDNSSGPLSVEIKWAWDSEFLYTLVRETAVDPDPAEGDDKFDWKAQNDQFGAAQPWASDSIGFYDTPSNGFCCDVEDSLIPNAKVGPWTQWWVGLSSDMTNDPDQVRMQARDVTDGAQTDDFLIDQFTPTGTVKDGTLIGEDPSFENEIAGLEFPPHTAAGQNVTTETEGGGLLRAIETRVPWFRLRYWSGTNPSGSDVIDEAGNRHAREDVGPGYVFRNDPLLVDGFDGSSWNSQSYPGGAADPKQVSIADMTLLRLTGNDCDLNRDGECDVADIDILMTGVASGSSDRFLDMNADGILNDADRDVWLAQAAAANGLSQSYLVGDSNLDRKVDAADLNAVGVSWQQSTSNWSEGNFSGGGVNAADLNAMAVNWRQEISDVAAAAVPEPTTFASVWVAIGVLLLWRRS